MSEATPPVRDDDLHAYVDEQLDAERRRIVERHLQTHSESAECVAVYQAQRAAIRAAFLKADTGALPLHLTLTGILAQRSAKQARIQAWRPWLAAACLAFAIFAGGIGGWFLHTGPTAGRGQRAMMVLEEQALASHAVFSVDNRHPVEVPGSDDAHLKQWFSNRLHRVIVVPNLSSLGYHLIGGRLLATERGNPAALLMYEDAQHQRMSVLLRPMGPALQMPSRTIDQHGVNGRAWIDDGLGIAVVASMPDHEIAEIATQINDAYRPTG